MNNTPKISLIMSVYNGEDYIGEALDSVLGQSFAEWELVVINDCSTDSTGEILKKYEELDQRIKVHTNETNLRLPSSLNKALSLSNGKYIARMDADDICLPDRLEKQYAFMEENPDVALSSCRFMTLKNGVISSGGCGGRCDFESIKGLLLVTNPILHPGIIAKAEVIKKLGYDKNFTCTEDMELWTRFVINGYKVEILPEYLMIYRLHDKQITGTTLKTQREEIKTVQKAYFSHVLEVMDAEKDEFYIDGVYFRRNTDTKKLLALCKWMKKANAKSGAIDKYALKYAMLEIIAEYKRCGVSKAEIVKAMMSLGLPFLVSEIRDRKKRARRDGLKCIEAAKNIGLEQSGGSVEFPTFSKR